MMRKIAPALFAAIMVAASATLALAGKYREAPELAALVRAGKLPPVEERLPKEPLVAEWSVKDGRIGKYGGVLRRATWDPDRCHAILVITHLIQAKHSFTVGCYPNLAKSYEMKDDGREWIIHLREGARWSDGHPYTVDDIIFWYEDIQLNKEVTFLVTGQLKSGGELVKFEKLDDYTLRIRAKHPYPLEANVSVLWYATRYPKHYLRQFHARYVGEQAAGKKAKELGFADWGRMVLQMSDPFERSNPDKPSMEPWVVTQALPKNPAIFKRNPYYWCVDQAGNQLPYINEMRYELVGNAEIAKLKALAGELDYMTFEDIISYPMFKKKEKEGKFKVFRWASCAINALPVEFNLTDKDPVLRKIFQDVRFRRAVSHAINRELINELVWLGLGEPWQVAPYETSRFYNERLAHEALEYDPDKSIQLLKEMGLKRNEDGSWLRPDGKVLSFTFVAPKEPSLPETAEILMENLKDIGLNVNLRIIDWGYLGELRDGNDHDAALVMTGWGTLEGCYLVGGCSHLAPIAYNNVWCPAWADWYITGGKKGEKPFGDAMRAIEAYDKAIGTLDPKEQEKWFKVVTDLAAKNLWTIGTNKFPGMIKLVSPRLRNVPTSFLPWHRGDEGRPDLWYYED